MYYNYHKVFWKMPDFTNGIRWYFKGYFKIIGMGKRKECETESHGEESSLSRPVGIYWLR